MNADMDAAERVLGAENPGWDAKWTWI